MCDFHVISCDLNANWTICNELQTRLEWKVFWPDGMQGGTRTKIFRFGQFELDVQSGELFQDDRKVPIQEQPLRILKLLVESPGEVVSRDEIRRLLWPGTRRGSAVNSFFQTAATHCW